MREHMTADDLERARAAQERIAATRRALKTVFGALDGAHVGYLTGAVVRSALEQADFLLIEAATRLEAGTGAAARWLRKRR